MSKYVNLFQSSTQLFVVHVVFKGISGGTVEIENVIHSQPWMTYDKTSISAAQGY